MTARLVFRNIGRTFRAGRDATVALKGVNLSLECGSFTAMIGRSGCGKSTLLNFVAGLDAPSSGTIDLHSARPAVMFQEAALMPWLTAAGNVELALRLAGVRRAAPRRSTLGP